MKRIQQSLKKVLEVFTAVAFGGLFLVTFLQVLFRYVFNSPFMWSEELVRYLFIWGVMVASGIVFGEGGHLAIEAFIDLLPSSTKQTISIGIYVVTALFSSFLAIYGGLWVIKAGGVITPSLNIPIELVYAAIPIGACVWTIESSRQAIITIRSMRVAKGRGNVC